MKYQELISQSKTILKNTPQTKGIFSLKIFEIGAKWMFEQIKNLSIDNELQFNYSVNYLGYGLLKYGISLLFFGYSAFLFYNIHILLLPLSIVIFYLVEIHFLFLFPNLIYNIKNPIFSSIKQIYKIGIIQVLIAVIPIGIFMVFGLLNYKDPLRNWYIGCLSIIIWYKNEIRNRI